MMDVREVGATTQTRRATMAMVHALDLTEFKTQTG